MVPKLGPSESTGGALPSAARLEGGRYRSGDFLGSAGCVLAKLGWVKYSARALTETLTL